MKTAVEGAGTAERKLWSTLKHLPRLGLSSVFFAFAIAGTAISQVEGNDGEPEEPPRQPAWFRLVNVDIPPDSPLRNSPNIDHPPDLYVIVKKDGTALGSHSTVHKGWSVDFPKGKPENAWPIWPGTQNRYTIEIWDSNWGSDGLVLTITGLRGEAFDKPIYEAGGKALSPDRLVTVTFACQYDQSTPENSSAPENK